MHHTLPTTEEARHAAFDLRRRMIESGRIDVDELKLQLDHDDNEDILHDLNPSLAIERLYERRGKMFGVLVCQVPDNSLYSDSSNLTSGDTVILKAYAGKLGGSWNLPGWSPIIGQVPESLPVFRRLRDEVTELFDRIDATKSNASPEDEKKKGSKENKVKHLTKKRARLATLALDEVRRHQLVTNFRGEALRPLTTVYTRGPTKVPGGTGDCAAPKLLAEAARLGLRPTGIAEIFVGATGGMSTGKGDGELYDACADRCEKIAGFMLCGLDDV
ncbi:hypothetical protein QTG54_016495 [Skeletonema marinoi]|uniref:Uncharacterized protein n=1 Tax=Skeletonema marinoi TaxID=267567 RepID=A0AAD8XSP9_9STRA|nr:hypothetical protein QTG54_016495 [Skeletonema marinoi]